MKKLSKNKIKASDFDDAFEKNKDITKHLSLKSVKVKNINKNRR